MRSGPPPPAAAAAAAAAAAVGRPPLCPDSKRSPGVEALYRRKDGENFALVGII